MRMFAWSVAMLVVAVAVASPALADADPASDVLYTRELFLPYNTKVSAAAEADLLAAISRSRTAGKEVRVALIASRRDLGGVPQLFGNPVYYARFLGAELQYLYSGRVLVVMPQGAGLAKGGRLIADRAVVAAKPGAGGDALARAATELVEEIATGKSASAPTGDAVVAPKPPRSSGFPVGLVTALAIGAVLVVIAVAGGVLARRRRA